MAQIGQQYRYDEVRHRRARLRIPIAAPTAGQTSLDPARRETEPVAGLGPIALVRISAVRVGGAFLRLGVRAL